MYNIFRADINTTDFSNDERIVLIAEKDTIEAFLEKLLTVMINSEVKSRDDIKICREMKDKGIGILESFKKAHKLKSN